MRILLLSILLGIFILMMAINCQSQINVVNTDSLKIGEKYFPTKFTIGGAIRLNYDWQTYNAEARKRGGDFGFELFRMDVDGECGDIYFSVQYRWYEYFEAIHHGYFGYHITPDFDLEIGIHQVPFGILPYASHSFWFGATYYLGFEDDYDTGIKLIYNLNNWTFHGAFYKNPEYIDPSRMGRYSFDLVTEGDQANQEICQGLSFMKKREKEYENPNRICVLVTVGDIIEQGGLIYSVSSLPAYIKAFFFTLPEGKIKVKQL